MASSRYSPSARYGFLWVTLAFFALSAVGHWIFAWFAYVDEQALHDADVEVGGFVVETLRDTLENWQSEFLQLIWQVAGLAFLLYIGSPQSKEGDDRKEEKIDALLEELHPKGRDVIAAIDKRYPKS